MLQFILPTLTVLGTGYGIKKMMARRKAAGSQTEQESRAREFEAPTPLWQKLREAESACGEPVAAARAAVTYALARRKFGEAASDFLDEMNRWLLRDELAGLPELEDCLWEIWYGDYSLREARHELMRLTSQARADRFEDVAEQFVAGLRQQTTSPRTDRPDEPV